MADDRETDKGATVALPMVVVGQTFWDYARMEDDDHNLAAVTRYVAGREMPDMPVNLRILAKVLANDGARVRDCIASKRERERVWKAAQRAKREAERRAEQSSGQQNMSTGQPPVSAHTNIQEGQPTNRKEEQKKEESTKEEKREEAREIESLFAAFWDAYPKKVAKQTAHGKFLAIFKAVKGGRRAELHKSMMAALCAQKQSDQWTRDGGQYIPHPTTWLNQARWEDEVLAPTATDESRRIAADEARLQAARDPANWELCAERCANCRGGACSAGVKWPPQLNDRPIPPEECDKYSQLHGGAR